MARPQKVWPMNDEQKNQLKAAIQEKIQSLHSDIEAFKELTRPVPPDNAIGRLTRMEAISAKSINAAALAKARRTLTRLERVLPRIEDAEFGLCRACENPIPFARLMILPEADLCVPCAEELGD